LCSGTNADTDQVLAQLRVAQAEAQLPAQVNTAGIVVQKSLSSPLMVVSLISPDKKYDVNFLTNYAIINLQDELTRIPGVARIQVFGGQYALRVWVHPDQLAKLGVTATDVINAIQVQNNVNPAGKIGGEAQSLVQLYEALGGGWN
jgi:HAE1 family hydrophobic/amphiphilic exporter-1